MKWLRAHSARIGTSWLALIALVAQAFVLSQHSAGATANRAERPLLSADLAALGLTLADLPCHTNRSAKSTIDPGTHPEPSPQKHCPVCALHSMALVALLPLELDLDVRPQPQQVQNYAEARAEPEKTEAWPPVRGPPLSL
jgi:hypothetical protein